MSTLDLAAVEAAVAGVRATAAQHREEMLRRYAAFDRELGELLEHAREGRLSEALAAADAACDLEFELSGDCESMGPVWELLGGVEAERSARAAAQPTVEQIGDIDRFTGVRRFRVMGGQLREDWREHHAKRYQDPPYCEVSLHGADHCVVSYGGSVWPSAWPALFRLVSRGTHGQNFYLTSEGAALFGLEAPR